MTDSYECKIEGCDWVGESKPSLRSHVSGSKDDDHQEARTTKAWEEWYPDEEGSTPSEEGGSAPSDEGTADPADDDLDDDPTEPTEGGGDSEGSSTPSDGGPDPTEEYAEQWGEEQASDTQDSEGSEEGSDPSDDGGDGGSDPSGEVGNGIGAGAALVAGSALVGLIVLLTRDNDDEDPIEVESTAEDVAPDAEGDDDVDLAGWEGNFE